MALSLVQFVKAESTGTQSTLALPAVNITAGNLVVIACRSGSNNAMTGVSPDTWTLHNIGTSSTMRARFASIQNHPGGSGIVYTVTVAGLVTTWWVALWEFSGAATSSGLDIQDTGTTAGTVPITSAGYTTTQADEVIFAIAGINATGGAGANNWSISPGFTVNQSFQTSGAATFFQCCGYSIVSSIQTAVQASATEGLGTLSGQTAGIIQLVSFKAAAAATFSISGNAGTAGATVSYSGAASGSVVADGSGNYTIPNLANGSYTITPSKGGYTFSPVSSNQTVAGSNITGVNFTATAVVVAANPIVGRGAPVPLRLGVTGPVDIVFSVRPEKKGGDFTVTFIVQGTVTTLTASLQVALDGVTFVDYLAAANFLSNTVTIKNVKPLIAGAQYRIHASALTGSQDFWVVAE